MKLDQLNKHWLKITKSEQIRSVPKAKSSQGPRFAVTQEFSHTLPSPGKKHE